MMIDKELEALKKLYPSKHNFPYYTKQERRWACRIVEFTLKKQARALEIIKNKKVNVRCIMSGWVLGKYNSYKAHIKLTEEEYELLKEVLLWVKN